MKAFTVIVVSQGQDWAVVSLPCELFIEHSLSIEAGSPFPHTALNTLANGHCGYLPTVEAFTRTGGYETKHLTSTYLVPEAGEEVVKTCIEMLTQLYAEGGG